MRSFKKIIAYMLVIAMVISSITVCNKTISADQSSAASYDWTSVGYLSCDATAADYTNKVKAVLADGTLDGQGIVNIQTASATEPSIYVTFMGADFGTVTINGKETTDAYETQGAGIYFHMSAFSEGANSVVVNNTNGELKAEIYVYYEGASETTTTTTAGEDESGYIQLADNADTNVGEWTLYAGTWGSGQMSYKGSTDDLALKVLSSNGNAGCWAIQAKRAASVYSGLTVGTNYTVTVSFDSTAAGTMFIKLEGKDDGATYPVVAGTNSIDIDFTYAASLGALALELSGMPAGTQITNIGFQFTEKSGDETTTTTESSDDFTAGEELLNRTDFGDGCLDADQDAGINALWIESSASGALFTNNGDGSVDIAVPAYSGTEDNYDTQLKQHQVNLVAGKWYRVRYAVTSDVDKTVQFLLQENGGSWEVYKSQNTVVKAGSTEYVEFVFQATTTTTNALYGLMMGPINGPCTAANVTISNVSLIGYDTEADAANHPRRVIDIISSATAQGVISLYWNVAGGNSSAPSGQVYDIEVDEQIVLTDVAYTLAELTGMSAGEHTITIYSKLGTETTEGYTVKVIVPQPAVTKLDTVVNQVTDHDRVVSIGSGWTYNFPLTGSDNYVGVDESNNIVVYSPTANSEAEYVYRSLTDMKVGKYYSYEYTILGDKENLSIPVLESSDAGYSKAYDVTPQTGTAYTYKNEMLADDDVITFRYDVRGLADAAIKISPVTAKLIEPVAAVGVTATEDVENINLNWSAADGTSQYQTYAISYAKDGGTPVEVVTGLTSTVTSYTMSGLKEGKYVITITSSINGKEVSVTSESVTIGAAVMSNDIAVEGFQIRTNDTSSSVAYRAICKTPNVGSVVTDKDGKTYKVKEFGTIYTLDANWTGFNAQNIYGAVHTVLDATSRETITNTGEDGNTTSIDRYRGAYLNNYTIGYVSTDSGILEDWNNDDTANTYYVQTMTNMDPQMAYSIHVRAFVVAEDGTIIYGDSTAVTSVAQIADYLYDNSVAKNYTAHSYLYSAILNSNHLTADGAKQGHPGAISGTSNNRYYRDTTLEYGWNGNLYTPSVIPVSVAWKYRMSTSNDMPSGWNAIDYDDSAWATGFAPFGDCDVSNINYNTLWADENTYIWMRRTFELKDATNYADYSIVLNTWYDDNPQIYLNGHLIFTDTDDQAWVDEYTTIDLGTEFSKYLVDGTNVVAIFCQNTLGGRMVDCGVTLVKK